MTPATAILTRSGIIIPALFVLITCLLARPFPVFADFSHTVTVDTEINSNVYGNSSDISGTDSDLAPNDNHLIIDSSGKVNSAYGGYINQSGNVTASDNMVTVHGFANDWTYGGYAISTDESSVASGNTVVLAGGTSRVIVGGYANSSSPTASALNNSITIESGTITNSIEVGVAGSVNGTSIATGNTININGGDFSSLIYISGGRTFTAVGTVGDSFSDNTLNKNSPVNLNRVQNFQFVNFGYGGTAGISTLDTTPKNSIQAGVTLNTNSFSVCFEGTIEGTGSLTKIGSGTLTLTGTDTYTVGMTVSDGFLQIGNGGTSGNITRDIENNASLVFNRSDAVSYGGIISGTGSLTKDGSGKLTLTGTNNYTGGTTVNAGTLEIGDGGTDGSITGNIVNDASLVFNHSDDVAYGDIISGTGSLIKKGMGDLTLTGTTTYSGETIVSAGTLAGNIPNDTDLTVESGASYETGGAPRALSALSGSGDIVNDNGLNVQSGSFGGAITGTGNLEKSGTGTLTLTGTNDYSGGTTVSDGTLEIGDGGTGGSITGDIENNASLIFNLSNDISYGGIICGTGSLTKDGGGKLTFTGINTYGGGTRILEGTLALSGAGIIRGPLSLFGGTTFDTGGTTVSPDRLDVHGSASWTGSLEMSGKELFFWVPSSMADGGVMLSVSGTAVISGSSVNVGLEGSSSPLRIGDSLILLNAAGALSFSPDNTSSGGQGMQGVTLKYDFGIAADGNRIRATVLDVSANSRAKALSEGFIAGVSFLNAGADLMAGQGMSEAVAAGKGGIPGGNSLGVFGVISGDRSRYFSGSHVDMKSLTLLVGLSLGLDLAPGHVTLGIFFEYGNGSYDTYNSFVNAPSVHGNGDIDRAGGGILGRMDFRDTGPGHFFAEASFRTGRVRNEFGSSDLRDVQGFPARYESSSNWYGFHLGTGYVWNVTDSVSLEIFGKYFRTTLKGDTVRLSTGDSVRFEDSDSSRLRLGWRLTWTLNEHLTPFFGTAWEMEFDGISRAYVGTYSVDSPSLRGDTGIGELGLSFRPSLSLPLTLELGVQGYVGKRKGASGSLNLKFEF
jgi:autotransporter-associated beta strand protein